MDITFLTVYEFDTPENFSCCYDSIPTVAIDTEKLPVEILHKHSSNQKDPFHNKNKVTRMGKKKGRITAILNGRNVNINHSLLSS